MQIVQRLNTIARVAAWRSPVVVALVGALLASGCGRQGDESHVAVECKEGPAAFRAALKAAPAEVRVLGRTAISSCLALRATDAADVQAVGGTLVTVATGYAERARRRPGSPEALRLGYLMGAIEKGTKRTRGIFQETLRRIETETDGVDRGGARYQEGLRAGRETG
jgi:hypothetical protein